MSRINILINKKSLAKKNNKVTGKICFYINEHYFPDSNWNDFIIIILNWWINSLLNINNELQYDLMFMDGPFLIRINIQNNEKIELKLIEKLKEERIIYSCLCDISILFNAVINATKELIDYIDSNKWVSDEINELKLSFMQINTFIVKKFQNKKV